MKPAALMAALIGAALISNVVLLAALLAGPLGWLIQRGMAAEIVVACGDPGVDRALRVVGETWRAAGLSPGAIDHRWSAGDVARMRNVGGSALLDAIDDLVAGLTRCRSRA